MLKPLLTLYLKSRLLTATVKTSIAILMLATIATGCHTPEDLREIGPQQEQLEAEWNPEGVNSPSLLDPQLIDDPVIGGGENLEKSILGTLIKTPYIPSRRRRNKGCIGC